MKHYVGLDVSMKDTFVCILDEQGKVIHQGHVRTNPGIIADRLKKFQVPIELAGIESGSLSHWLVDELRKLDVPAICIDARKMAAILSVQVNKTDKNDAKGIADAMRCGLYREVTQKSQAAMEISTLMGCRKVLVERKVQSTNVVRGHLKTYGIRLGPTTDSNFVKSVREALPEKYPIAKLGIEALLRDLEALYENIKMLTKTVEALAREDEDVQRLTTIPGVGTITAMTFKAEIDEPNRFKNSRAVGAYLGMTPRQYSSGEVKRLGRISKCGSSELRALLNEAALVLLSRSKRWSKVKAWGLKIQRKHGFKKACMAVARKLAVIMHRMWLDKTDFVYGEPKDAKPKCTGEIPQEPTRPTAEAIQNGSQLPEEAHLEVCIS
jgi:transposase